MSSSSSPKQTIAQFVVQKYYDLEGLCYQKIGKFPLPPLGEIDQNDIVLMLLTFFKSHYETGDYLPVLSVYGKMKGVSEEEMAEVYPDAKDFIHSVLTVLKEKEL